VRPRQVAVLAALALGSLLPAGCGGGGAGSSVPAASTATVPAGKAQVTFLIDVPKNTASARGRSPQFISPATTQMAINIQQNAVSVSGYPVTVPLTPTSGGCTSTLANTTCQLTVTLPLGNYTATLTTEDANATALSSAQNIAFTVRAGTNTVPLTLSGIPHALQILSGARAVHGVGTSGLVLYGSAAQPVIVTAVDADGNTIVGPGAPTYSASLVTGTGWSAAAPASTAPNTIAITPPGSNGSGATFSVTATYPDTTCAQPGAVCSTTFTVKNDIQTLFVANTGANTVTVYAPPYTGGPTTIVTGMYPLFTTLDGAGNLFVVNENDSTVTEYAPPYTGGPTTTISTGVNGPDGLLLDNSGNLFIANGNVTTVTEYAPPYAGAPTTTISTGVNGPGPLALDVAGNLFVPNSSANTVTVYAPPYTGAPTATISTGVNSPFSIVLDAAKDLFVANTVPNRVTVYAPPYTGAPTTISTGVNDPEGLVIDSTGNLFVSNGLGNTVTEYAPPYTGAPKTTITTGLNQPSGIVLDGAGNLFVANYLGNTVTEYAPPYTGPPVATISTSVNQPFGLLLTR